MLDAWRLESWQLHGGCMLKGHLKETLSPKSPNTLNHKKP